MTDKDFEIVNSIIDEEKELLNNISQEIWKNPELLYKEVHAHALLTCALSGYGFEVKKHYFIPTAFRADYSSKTGEGPTVAILLEYDALPDIGHACGHNLIAEAGLAAALATKVAMEQDTAIVGKLVVLGTPAEEGGGGKIKLLELGAFDDVDVALMVHPAPKTILSPCFLSSVKGSAHFKGKEAHAGAAPWEGINALDAAVACYQSIALLRQQIKPTCRINVIITKSGTAVNIIPAESSLEFLLRASTKIELQTLVARVESCIRSAGEATGCETKYSFREEDCYENLITNSVLISQFDEFLKQLDFDFGPQPWAMPSTGSTDMGNVSHRVPSIHPFYGIPASSINHTKGFTAAAGADTAQIPTLKVGKALALTALKVMRNPELVEEAKSQFQQDLVNEQNIL